MQKLVLSVFVCLVSTNVAADIHCRFDPNAAPSTYVRVSPKRKTGIIKVGAQKAQPLREVVVQQSAGAQVIRVFGDVILIQARFTGSAKLWFDRNEMCYPYEAHFNPRFPGGPTRQAFQGVCWTDKMQPQYCDRYRTGG